MFSRTRNPNYLGETLIYWSFAIACDHWLAYAIVLIQAFGLFAVMTIAKDVNSYSKKQGWEEYRSQTGRILPQVSGVKIINSSFYILLAVAVVQLLAWLRLTEV